MAAAYYPANKRYKEKNIVQVTVSFNRSTEPDLAARVEAEENKAGYIKRLVREDVDQSKKSR